MIRTDDCLFIAAPANQPVAAVLTNVVHGLERLILPPHDEDVLIEYRKAEIVAHIGYLTSMARQLPSLEINLFLDTVVNSSVGEVGRVQPLERVTALTWVVQALTPVKSRFFIDLGIPPRRMKILDGTGRLFTTFDNKQRTQ